MNKNVLLQTIKNPFKIIKHIGGKGYLKWIPDKLYLKLCYFGAIGKKLNLNNPKTFNEKIQWLKLYDRKSVYTTMVDKCEVKKYVANIIGEEYIIPTLGVWNKFEDIDFDSLPNQFVLKCTHDSGGLVICKDKSNLDMKAAQRKINKSLKRDFYYVGREWAYKNVKPRIIAEKYIEEDKSGNLKDFKFMCFNERVKCLTLCTNRFSGDEYNVTFYDENWNVMPCDFYYPRSKTEIERPHSYDEMVKLSEKISKDIPFVRVDFYEIKERPYFGEVTFYPGNGFQKFTPYDYDEKLGDWIDLL